MSTLADCCAPTCCTTVPVNIPGIPGTDGGAGTDGLNAFSVVGSQFTIPPFAGNVAVTFSTSTAWMVVGQIVIVGQGSAAVANPGPATFKVISVDSSTQATLQKVAASGDASNPTAISAGAICSPAGVPGTSGLSNFRTGSIASPTGTASVTQVMLGLGQTVTAILTPTNSGRVMVTVTTMAGNTVADGVNAQLRYGTGAAPNNGDAFSGTALGSIKHFVASTTAGRQGVALSFIVTGLTLNTAYWFDLGFNAVTGGTATLYDVDISIVEI